MKREQIQSGAKVRIISIPIIEDVYYQQLSNKALNQEAEIIRLYEHGERPLLVRYGKYGELVYLTLDNVEAAL